MTSTQTIGALTALDLAGTFGDDLDGDTLNDDLYIEFHPVACNTLPPAD